MTYQHHGRNRIERAVAVRDHHSAKWTTGHFVAWDGEGWNHAVEEVTLSDGKKKVRATRQHYGLLMVWDKRTPSPYELYEADGIPTGRALRFITETAARFGRDATHVGYGFSYDANMILKDLSADEIQTLGEGDAILYARRFRVKYRPHKSLYIKDISTGHFVTLWDTLGFHQTSFIKTVEANLGTDDPRLPNIRKGKAMRPTFDEKMLPFIRRYTTDELSALVDVTDKLWRAFQHIGWKLRRWDGAGAAAAALLEREGVKRLLNRNLPPDVTDAALRAFAGGRIEAPQYGYYVGVVDHADIRSAYPKAISTMPNLARCTVRHIDGLSEEPFSLVRVSWDFQRLGDDWPLLPFKFREKHSIYFPRRGESWVWAPEVHAALKWDDLRRRIKVHESIEFIPDDGNDRPFYWIKRWYQERARLRADPSAGRAHVAVKLGLNSVYGKMAQTVGARIDKNGNLVLPPFHQIEYAGYITSFTRAQLFDALAPVRKGTIMLATDGIYSTETLKGLTWGEDLGQWEHTTHDAMLTVQSGVYWCVNPTPKHAGSRCEKCDGKVSDGPLRSVRCLDPTCQWSNLTHHFRGFDEDSLSPEAILDAWRKKRTEVAGSSHRFVGMKYAYAHESTQTLWRAWVDEPRTLEIYATGKRVDVYPPSAWNGKNPARGLLPTRPASVYGKVSEPYDPKYSTEAKVAAEDALEAVGI